MTKRLPFFLIPQNLLKQMEKGFNTDFKNVKIFLVAIPKTLKINAFTDGNHIYIDRKHYQPCTFKGRCLIAHELAHIMQQRQGRVLDNQNTFINQVLECEAELHSLLVMLGYRLPCKLPSSQITNPIIQYHFNDDEEAYYSSEDDEKPEDRNEYNNIVNVLYHIYKKINNLRNLKLTELESGDDFRVIFCERITKYKEEIEKASRDIEAAGKKKMSAAATLPIFVIESPSDWVAFAIAMRKFLNENYVEVKSKKGKEKEKKKETKKIMKYIYNYDFQFRLWHGTESFHVPVRKFIFRRGRPKPLLVDPGDVIEPGDISTKDKHARGYRQIANELHEMAKKVGVGIFYQAKEKGFTEKQIEQAGTQILALAILYVYFGRGDEAKEYLQERLSVSDFKRLEELLAEHIGLNFCFEPTRFLYTHFDNLINLANIAHGHTFGSGLREQRFDFLNVYSWIRKIQGKHQHVYLLEDITPTENQSRSKFLTKYRKGFRLGDPKEALSKKDSLDRRKATASLGKALATSSGSFWSAKVFLKAEGDKTGATETRNTVFSQLKTYVNEKEKQHEDRLKWIGPIRVYNTIANLLKSYHLDIRYLGRHELSQYADQLFKAYLALMQSKTPAEGIFKELFIGENFLKDVSIILNKNQEQAKEINEIEKVFLMILGDKNLNELYNKLTNSSEEHTEATKRLQTYIEKHYKLIDKLVSEHPDLVHAYLKTHANDCFKDGYSFLQKALMIGHIGLIDILTRSGANWNYANKEATVDDIAKLHGAIYSIYGGRLNKANIKNCSPVAYTTEWLTSNHIEGIFEAYKKEMAKTHPNAIVTKPAENNCCTAYGRNNLIRYLKQGIEELKTEGVVIVPIHWDSHWCTLVLHKSTQGISIYYFDSTGRHQERERIIKEEILNKSAIPDVDSKVLEVLSLSVQHDKYACGTWSTEAGKIIASQCLNGEIDAIDKELTTRLGNLQKIIKKLHDENYRHYAGASEVMSLLIESNNIDQPEYRIQLDENKETLRLFEILKDAISHLSGNDVTEKQKAINNINNSLSNENLDEEQIKLAMQCLISLHDSQDILKIALNNKMWDFAKHIIPVMEINEATLQAVLDLLKNKSNMSSSVPFRRLPNIRPGAQNKSSSEEISARKEILEKTLYYYLGNPEPHSSYAIDPSTIQREVSKVCHKKIICFEPYDAYDRNFSEFINNIRKNKANNILYPINLGSGNWAMLVSANGKWIFYHPDNVKRDNSIYKFIELLAIAINQDDKAIIKIYPVSYHAKNNDLKGAHIIGAAKMVAETLGSGKDIQYVLSNDMTKQAMEIFSEFNNELKKENAVYSTLTSSVTNNKLMDSSQINLILQAYTTDKTNIKYTSAGSSGGKDLTNLKIRIQEFFEQDGTDAMMVPLNQENQHWCSLFIIKANNDVPLVLYFDSKGNIEENRNRAREAVELLVPQEDNERFIDLSSCVQIDNHACGTWMLESFKWLIENYLPKLTDKEKELNLTELKNEFLIEFSTQEKRNEILEFHDGYLVQFPPRDDGLIGIEQEEAKRVRDQKIEELEKEATAFPLAKRLIEGFINLKDGGQIAHNQIISAYKELDECDMRLKNLVLYYCYYTLLHEHKVHPLAIAIKLKDPHIFRDFFNRIDCNPHIWIEHEPLLDHAIEAFKENNRDELLHDILHQIWQGLLGVPKQNDYDLKKVLEEKFKGEDITIIGNYDFNTLDDPFLKMTVIDEEIGMIACSLYLRDIGWALLVRSPDDTEDHQYSLLIQGESSEKIERIADLLANLLDVETVQINTLSSPVEFILKLENTLDEKKSDMQLEESDAERIKSLELKYFGKKTQKKTYPQAVLLESIMGDGLSLSDIHDSIAQLNGLHWKPKIIWRSHSHFHDFTRYSVDEFGLRMSFEAILNHFNGSAEMTFSDQDSQTMKKRRITVGKEEKFNRGKIGIIDLSIPFSESCLKNIEQESQMGDKLIMWMVKVDKGYYFPIVYDRNKKEIHLWDTLPAAAEDSSKINLMRWLFSGVEKDLTVKDHSEEVFSKLQLQFQQGKVKPDQIFNVTFECISALIGENQDHAVDCYGEYVHPLDKFESNLIEIMIKNIKNITSEKQSFYNLFTENKNSYKSDIKNNLIHLNSNDRKNSWEKTLYEFNKLITSKTDTGISKKGDTTKRINDTFSLQSKDIDIEKLKSLAQYLVSIIEVTDEINKSDYKNKNEILKTLKQYFNDLLDIAFSTPLLEGINLQKDDMINLFFQDKIKPEPILFTPEDYKKNMYGDKKVEYPALSPFKDNFHPDMHNAYIELINILEQIHAIDDNKLMDKERKNINEEIIEFYKKYGRLATQAIILSIPELEPSYLYAVMTFNHDKLSNDVLIGLNSSQFLSLLNRIDIKESYEKIDDLINAVMSLIEGIKKNTFCYEDFLSSIKSYDDSGQISFNLSDEMQCVCHLEAENIRIEFIYQDKNFVSSMGEQFILALIDHAKQRGLSLRSRTSLANMDKPPTLSPLNL